MAGLLRSAFFVSEELLFLISILGGTLLVVATMMSKSFVDRGFVQVGRTARVLVMAAGVWNSVTYLAIVVMIHRNGAGSPITFVILVFPLVVAFLPFVSDTTRLFVGTCGICAVLLGIFSFLGSFSVGPFFPPSGALLVAAGSMAWRQGRISG